MKKFLIISILFVLCIGSGVEAQSKIKVETLDKKKIADLIHERNGKILFLNLWATWCVPCREEFPDIVKLVQQYGNKNVEFVGLSIDYPEEIKSKILPFLKKNKANFKNYVNGIRGDEELINLLEEKWNGALPATFIYDAEGNKLKFLQGKQKYDEFKSALDEIK